MQFEPKSQSELIPQIDEQKIPAILISQLIGLSIALDEETLGLKDDIRLKLLVSA
jgi:heterodisulfide reductase subunit B